MSIDFFSVDLGSDTIKIARARQDGDDISIEDLAMVKSSLELLTNESVEGTKQLADTIKDVYKRANLKTRNCVASLTENVIFSRMLTLPKVEDSQVPEAVHWALKPVVPTPLDNVNISFLEINEVQIDGKPFVNWYAVAAPKELINRLVNIFESAGLNLLAVETETLAISRMVAYNYGSINSDLMILDIGADDSNVILARNGVTMFSQSVSTGSSAFDKMLSADFGMDMAQAEQLKRNYSMQSEENKAKIAKSLDPILQALISEVSRTIVYYKEKLGSTPLNKLYLTGGGSKLTLLPLYFNQKLGIEVEIVNPLMKLKASDRVRKISDKINLSSFNVAIGLALKGAA